MRDAEFKAVVVSLLETICGNTRRIAEACERAERWTTYPDVTPANAAAALLGEDDGPALPPEDPGSTRPRPDAGKRKRGRRG